MNFITIITKMSLMCGIPPQNIEAILRVESNYCTNIINKKSSAVGCFQLLKVHRDPADDHTNPETSIHRGVALLCNLKSRFPRTYMLRYYVGPSGDIKSEKALEYKRRLNLENKYFKGEIK